MQNLAQAGDNIVSVSQLYGGSYNLFAHTFPRQGIEVRFAAHDDIAALGESRALVHRRRAVAHRESAAVEPDHHRQLALRPGAARALAPPGR